MARNAKGYSYNKATGLWFAYMNRNGKRVSLGYHKTEAEAAAARKKGLEEAGKTMPPNVSVTKGCSLEVLERWYEYHSIHLVRLGNRIKAMKAMTEQEEALDRMVHQPHRDKLAAELGADEFKGFL